MIKTHWAIIVSRQQVKSSFDESDCYAYETDEGEYYLGYHDKTDEHTVYMTDEPVEKDKLEFIGEKEIPIISQKIITKSEII